MTLDLEPDFLKEGCHDVFLNEKRMDHFLNFFDQNHLKLTTYVVGNMLEQNLPVRETFVGIENEFELHSYSHNVKEPDSEAEIVQGKASYINYFGHSPQGYRAPNGHISPQGLAILHREGFLYDASVFPARRPELGYNFANMPTMPWIYAEYPLVELPFAVILKTRLVISLSFLKLFGLSFYKLMFHLFGFPEIIVFDCHLYDFFLTTPIIEMPRTDWRRYPLTRNLDRSFYLLQGFVDFLRAKGYAFIFMSDLYQHFQQSPQLLPIISAQELTA